MSRDLRDLRLASAARWYRRLLTAYPPSFRNRFASDLVELFTDLYATQAATASKPARARFWFAIVVDTVRQGARERIGRRRTLPLGAHRSPRVPHMTHLFEDLRHAMRFVMLLMSFAAALALLLAGVGTYSVLSYTVQRRAREVGVRMALGATQAAIARLMLGHTAVLTALGVVLGLAGALAMTRLITAQLYEVSPRDPLTL